MNRKIIFLNKNQIFNLNLETSGNILLNKIIKETENNNDYCSLIFLPKKVKKLRVIRSPHVNKKSMESFSIYRIKLLIPFIANKSMNNFFNMLYFSEKFLFEYFNIIMKSIFSYFIFRFIKKSIILNLGNNFVFILNKIMFIFLKIKKILTFYILEITFSSRKIKIIHVFSNFKNFIVNCIIYFNLKKTLKTNNFYGQYFQAISLGILNFNTDNKYLFLMSGIIFLMFFIFIIKMSCKNKNKKYFSLLLWPFNWLFSKENEKDLNLDEINNYEKLYSYMCEKNLEFNLDNIYNEILKTGETVESFMKAMGCESILKFYKEKTDNCLVSESTAKVILKSWLDLMNFQKSSVKFDQLPQSKEVDKLYVPENLNKLKNEYIKNGDNEFLLNKISLEVKHAGLRQFLYFLKENDYKAYIHLKNVCETIYPHNDVYMKYLFDYSPKNPENPYFIYYDENNHWLKDVNDLPKINTDIFNFISSNFDFYTNGGFIPWSLEYEPRTFSNFLTEVSSFVDYHIMYANELFFSAAGIIPFCQKTWENGIFTSLVTSLRKEKKACKEFIDNYYYYDYMDFSTKIQRYFTDNYDDRGKLLNKRIEIWNNFKIPINISEMHLQAELFIEKIVYSFIPEFPKSFFNSDKNLVNRPDNWSLADEGTIFFEKGFEEFKRLFKVYGRDQLWYYEPAHTYTQRQLEGDYWYLICTNDDTKEEAVAVFKKDKWVDVTDFKSYLLNMREDNHFLRERQTVLYDVAKYYDLHAYESGFNRRIQWSKDYSQTLYKVALNAREKAIHFNHTFNEYRDFATLTWKNDLMWGSKAYADKPDDIYESRLQFLDWWETFHKDAYGPEPIIYIYSALSVLLIFTILDIVLQTFKSLTELNFVIKYKRLRTKVNIALYKMTGFTFFYSRRVDGVSYIAQISVVLLAGLEYHAHLKRIKQEMWLTTKKKWKTQYIFSEDSDGKILNSNATSLIPMNVNFSEKKDKKWSYGWIITKESDLWILFNRFTTSFKELIFIIIRFLSSLFERGGFTSLFNILFAAEFDYLNNIWLRITSIPRKFKMTIINTCSLLEKLFLFTLDFIENFPEYMSKIFNFLYNTICYTIVLIIDSIIFVIFLIKDEILLFLTFLINLLIDWIDLIVHNLLLINFSKKLEKWHSYIREWHFHYYLWDYILKKNFSHIKFWLGWMRFEFPDFYYENEIFAPTIAWEDYTSNFVSKWTSILFVDSFSQLKENLSMTFDQAKIAYTHYYENEKGRYNYYSEKVKENGFWETIYVEYHLDRTLFDTKYKVIKYVFIDSFIDGLRWKIWGWYLFFKEEIIVYILYRTVLAFQLYAQYDYWIYNSPVSFIYYPLVSLWRVFVNQTSVSLTYLGQIIWYNKSLDRYNNLTFKRVAIHFKNYFSEVIFGNIKSFFKELKLIINTFFEIIFYPFMGLWWYFKRTLRKLLDSKTNFINYIRHSDLYDYIWTNYTVLKHKFLFKYSPIHTLKETYYDAHGINAYDVMEKKIMDKEFPKKEEGLSIEEFMSSKDKYIVELLKGYVRDHDDLTITKNWHLSKKTQDSIDEVCIDLMKVNLFKDAFPLTSNEKLLESLGLYNHINRNIALLKKMNLTKEAFLLEGIFYEKTYMPLIDSVAKEDTFKDYKIYWLPKDIYFTLPKFRLLRTIKSSIDNNMYLTHLYTDFIDVVFKGGFAEFAYKVVKLGPYYIPTIITDIYRFLIHNYIKNEHILRIDVLNNYINRLGQNIYDRIFNYYYFNYGVMVFPSAFNESYIFKEYGISWTSYILTSLKDHFYYSYYDVPSSKWKDIYTIQKDLFRNTNNYWKDRLERVNQRQETLGYLVKERIKIWDYFYENKFSKINVIKNSRFNTIWELIKESIKDYNDLKNYYIENKFRFEHEKYYRKYETIPFDTEELFNYYNLRIKYSLIFLIKFLYEGFFTGIKYVCFDIYKFISSVLWSPIHSISLYNFLFVTYNDLKIKIYKLLIQLQKDFIEIFIHDLYIFYKKCLEISYFYINVSYYASQIFLNEIYIKPIKEKFNIDLRSLYKRSFSDFFISFFYLEERITFKEIKALIKFIYKQTILGLKKIFNSLYDILKPYIEELNIYLKMKIRPFSDPYFIKLASRLDEIEIIYKKSIPIKIKEFNYVYNMFISTEFNFKTNIILSIKILYKSLELFLTIIYTSFEVSIYFLNYIWKDAISFIRNSYFFFVELGSVIISLFVSMKFIYIKSFELTVYYVFLFFRKIYDFSFVFFGFIMNLTAEIIFALSDLITYISKDILSINSIFKYIFIFVHGIFEFLVKLIDIFSISINFIYNFSWNKYIIYLNMYFNKIYSYISGGNFWWYNPYLITVYIKLKPIIDWIEYNLTPIKGDVTHVLIRGDIGRGLPFLIGDKAVQRLSEKQKQNIKEFFEYQEGLRLGDPREVLNLWTIDNYIKGYINLLDKSNMPTTVKKFFYLEFIHKTFYEALLRSTIKATGRDGKTVKKFEKMSTSSRKEILAYFEELLLNNPEFTYYNLPVFGLNKSLSLKDVHDESRRLFSIWTNYNDPEQRLFIEHGIEGQVDLAKAENVYTELTPINNYWEWYNEHDLCDDLILDELIWEDDYMEDLMDLDEEYNLFSAAAYYKDFSESLDTYDFAAFNQKIYNFYLDNFGPSFAYIYYHFPGNSLQLNDARFNYIEKVQFLRNFIYTNDSFVLSNLSLVNRLNSLDFFIYMKQEEDMYDMCPILQTSIDYNGDLIGYVTDEFDDDDGLEDLNVYTNDPYFEDGFMARDINTFTWLRHLNIYFYGKFKEYMVESAEKKYYDPTYAIIDYLDFNFTDEDEYYERFTFFNEECDEDSIGFGSEQEDDSVLYYEDYYLFYENEWEEFPPKYFQGHSPIIVPEKFRWIFDTEYYHDSIISQLLLPEENTVWTDHPFIKSSYFSYLEENFTPASATTFRRGKYEFNHTLNDSDFDLEEWVMYGIDWSFGGVNIVPTDREPLEDIHFSDLITWQQAFLDSLLTTRDFFYNYGVTGESIHQLREYEEVVIQGNPWLDTKEVNRIIRERMTNKPLCYDYWVHYEDMDIATSTSSKFENISSLNNSVLYDAPSSFQIGFQDPASPIMEGIIDLHHDLFFFLILVSVFVSWVLFNIIYYFNTTNYNLRINLRDRIDDEMKELTYDFIRLCNFILLRLIKKLNKDKDNQLYKTLIKYVYEVQIRLIYSQETRLNKSYHDKELEYLLINSKINSDTLLPNNMTDLLKYIGKNDYNNIEYFYNEKEKKGYFVSKENTEVYNRFKNDPANVCNTKEVSLILNNLLTVRDLQLKLSDNYFDAEKEKNHIFELMDDDILKYENFEEDFVEYKLKEESVWFPQLFTHNTTIEVIWTIIPAIILVFIAIPSFSLLYAMDQIWQPLFTIKVLGNQWYWSYEYC